jgi:hypothetical protein
MGPNGARCIVMKFILWDCEDSVWVFWDITRSSMEKAIRCLRGKCCFHLQGQRLKQATFMLVSWLSYSSALKMEVVCSSETLLDFHWTTWHHIPVDRTLVTTVKTSDPVTLEFTVEKYSFYLATTEQ